MLAGDEVIQLNTNQTTEFDFETTLQFIFRSSSVNQFGATVLSDVYFSLSYTEC